MFGARRGLRDISTTLKNQIYSELTRRGIAYEPGCLSTKKERSWVQATLTDCRVQALLRQLDLLEEGRARYNKEVLLPKYNLSAEAQLLATIPGVGYYTALTAAAFIGDARRFRESDALISYAGLAPRVSQPSSSLHLGPITKAGPHLLRWVLHEAFQMHRLHCPTKDTCQLCTFYRRVCRRRGKYKAVTAGAAKLLRVMYWMLKMNEPYHPQGLEPRKGTEGEPR